MTTLQLQFAPHFLAPVTEDPMELTSDMDQRAGGADDIDIDLDLTGDNQQDGEDENMGEEDMNSFANKTSADGPETHATNDDEMADDSYAQGLIDEGSSVRDEEIEDVEYTGPELDEDTIVEPDTNHLNEQSEELLANYEQISRDQNQEQDYQEQEQDYQEQEQDYQEREQHEHAIASGRKSSIAEKALSNRRTVSSNSSHDVAKVGTERTSGGYNVEISKEARINSGAADQSSELSDIEGLIAPEAKLELVKQEVLPVSLDQEVVSRSNVEESHIRNEEPLNDPAHLHPIVLDYQGDEMFLFPPVDQSGEHPATFLLADEQLAYSTIGNLLEACRYVLKQSLSEQDELMINFHDLDLHISESTIEGASRRLSEVLDLYLRLQQNDGLENPPPLYIDLVARNRFSCRFEVLRNASVEGTGLSQLKRSQDTETSQQHRSEGEMDPSNYNIVQSPNEAYGSEQQLKEEAEGRMDRFALHGHPPPFKNLMLETDSGAQGTQSSPIKDFGHEKNDLARPLLGADSSVPEVGGSEDFDSKAAGSEESLKPAQPLVGEAELHKTEEPTVDDGDFIDYEDVEELEGGTSSESSTLQGDTIDVRAVRDHGPPKKPIIAQNQEHQSPQNVRGDMTSAEKISSKYIDKKDTSDSGVSFEEEQSDAAATLSQYSDENSQSLSRQFDEEEKASEIDQDASISQGSESELKANADDQHEASAQYEHDAGICWQSTLHEHTDPIEGDARPLDETNDNGEVEDHSTAHPIDSEPSRSQRNFRDDDLESVSGLEAENELEEADVLLAEDGNDDASQLLGDDTGPSLSVGESVQTQEDDDEITYEDEDYDIDPPHKPAQVNPNIAISPGLLKRARDLHEGDDTLEENLQDSKRVRSG